MPRPTCQRLPLSQPAVLAAILLLSLGLFPHATLAQSPAGKAAMETSRMSVVMPVIDAKRGRRLFVTKGCFICHSVKGVGGKAAPPLDAGSDNHAIDVLDFIARLWKGAPIMFELQAMELGYRVEFTASELADLAGFIGDSRAQEGFAEGEIPELVREWKVDDAWWKDPSIEDWRTRLPKEFPKLDEFP